MSVGPNYHVENATAEPLLQRLDGLQKSGNGWRARCPACGGRSRKLAITEASARVLVHCFGGCHPADVLAAVGLSWADVQPPRHWPQTPDERRGAMRAIRDVGLVAAVEILSLEGTIVRLAAQMLERHEPLSTEDDERLALACQRIDNAALVLVNRESWKPDDCFPPAALVNRKRKAVSELRRQLDQTERELGRAEKSAEIRP